MITVRGYNDVRYLVHDALNEVAFISNAPGHWALVSNDTDRPVSVRYGQDVLGVLEPGGTGCYVYDPRSYPSVGTWCALRREFPDCP